MELVFDREAEEQTIGAILMNEAVIPEVTGVLGEDENIFFIGAHKCLYRAVLDLVASGSAVDAYTVAEYCKRKDLLNYIGGGEKIMDLMEETMRIKDSTPTAESAKYYAEVVREKAVRRKLQMAASEIYSKATAAEIELDDVLAESSNCIFSAVADSGSAKEETISTVLQTIEHEASERMAGREVKGRELFTGFPSLDFVLYPGEVTIIAGRPSTGKSSLAHCIALYNLQKQLPVIFFSLEMTSIQLLTRMLSTMTEIPYSSIVREKMDEQQFAKMQVGVRALESLPLKIISKPRSVPEMAVDIRRFQVEAGNDEVLVIIDYAQLVKVKGTGERSLYETTTEVAKAVKNDIAKQMNLSTILLSQVSRRSEHTGKRITIADLRDSGALEEHAGAIMLIQRFESDSLLTQDDLSEIETAKNRLGKKGTCTLKFNKECTMFKSL